jgi:CDP-glycerol glycerophosphotransferase (TagB/SpsB family)
LRARTRLLGGGRVSVVVVVDDNNASSVGDCLEALEVQRRRPDGVLVVDITATAVASRMLAEAVATSRLGTVEVVVLPAATKPQALSQGLQLAGNEYAMLVDAGDVLTPGAVDSLARSLHRSGSAVAVAGQVDAQRVGLAEVPDVIGQPDLATRMFRRRAVDVRLDAEPVLEWVPATRLLLDGPFDVVADPVRARPRQGTGAAFGAMPARADSVPAWSRAVLDLIGDPRVAEARTELACWLLATSVPEYLDDAERCSDTSWSQVRDTARTLFSAAPAALARVPASCRAYAWLASQDRRADVVELGVWRWKAEGTHATRVAAGRVYAVLPVPGVPDEMLEMHEAETGLVAKPWRADSGPGSDVRVSVRAFVRGVGDQHGDVAGALTLVAPDGGRHELDVDVHGDPDVNRWAQEPHQDHTRALFIGRGQLPSTAGSVGAAWRLEVSLRVAGIVRSGTAPGPSWCAGGGWRVTRLALDGTTLTVTGQAAHSGTTTLELRGPQGQLVVRRAVTTPFMVQLPLEHDPWSLGSRPLSSGTYRLVVDDGPLRLAGAASLAGRLESRAYRIVADPGPWAVRLIIGPPLGDDETGAWSQRQLQRWYSSPEQDIDQRLVLLQSYTGQACTDSPRAIHDALRRLRPDLELVWAVADSSTQVPSGGRAVQLRSREWYRTLATAGHLVTNIDMERWFSKRPGQRLLQTYHGYPSKAMGIAAWKAKNLTPGRIAEQLRRTSGTWDLLLTPTPSMDEHYREQYRYDGPIHPFGYPRDDVLVGPDAPTIREVVRKRLGLRDRLVVLYAPTWRDDLATNFRVAAIGKGLDAELLADALGDDVAVLLRGHRFHRERESGHRGLRDVTDYPEVNDLILAADVAVLDYSSLRFDFALTGRPMVFLVPDLERYEYGVRGFLYDFRSSAPGPLLDTTEEVVDALRDLPGLRSAYQGELERFNHVFNSHQDGAAADRVVDAFFGSRG